MEEIQHIKEEEINELKKTSNEEINDIVRKAKEETKLEIIKKYNNKEKQDLIQEIEHQKLIINKLNDKEKVVGSEFDKNVSKISLGNY